MSRSRRDKLKHKRKAAKRGTLKKEQAKRQSRLVTPRPVRGHMDATRKQA